ncbi:P-loop containing nucleoside triphosphate hydrolase protein [Hyaloscypha variabilis]
MDPAEVEGDDLLICSPTLRGFSLGNSRWAALDDLHIPEEKKKAARALSKALVKRASTTAFNHVVKGKGQGFNVLLHGPPGVGKTLTAKLLAEHLQKPLMQVSAILLLNEADVLLKQRSAQDIHRNALVYVFLRTLEYYQGIMFLTTNQVGQIDNAIASRIHFKLKYRKAATPQGEPIYSQDAFDG